MKKLILKIMAACFFIIVCGLCFADNNIQEMPAFNKNDRVIVFVPHPDDEAIGTGGVLQELVKSGIPTKIVYYTNGDNNELAFIVYEKRIVFLKKAFVYLGEVRRKESVSAMKYLGFKDSDFIFLGYPDFGTINIFTGYWGQVMPFRGMFTRVTSVPYKECFSYNAPYIGDSILNDIKKILVDFKPTKIFVSSPVDTNGDHRSLYLFLQVALLDLENLIPPPEVFEYIIHYAGWPIPRGFHPKLELKSPMGLSGSDVNWVRYVLDDQMIDKKKKAISFYKSQIECNPPYLFTFARKNELFGRHPVIDITEEKSEDINWVRAENKMNIKSAPEEDSSEGKEAIDYISYAKSKGFIYVKIRLSKFMSKTRGIELYLFGYKREFTFSDMPKIRIHFGWKKSMTIFEKRRRVFVNNASFYFKADDLIIKFPLVSLNSPDYIFTSARTKAGDLVFDKTAWRILKLQKEKPASLPKRSASSLGGLLDIFFDHFMTSKSRDDAIN